jgi:cell shape-determining protein MreC
MIENARLRWELKQEKTVSGVMQPIDAVGSLAQLQLIQATVVSSSGLPDSLRDLIVDAGRSAGITRSELVIAGDGALIDAGSDQNVSAGDRVLAGAVVVGRVEKAARWVSLVQPVTAAGFKAHVMLLRRTSDGFHFGTTGMLEGAGESECLLTGIPHTEAVAVGDEVISADVNGVRGPQLYFGRVTRAEFLAGGQWDVRVQPAASVRDLETVGILRLNLTAREKKSGNAGTNAR